MTRAVNRWFSESCYRSFIEGLSRGESDEAGKVAEVIPFDVVLNDAFFCLRSRLF